MAQQTPVGLDDVRTWPESFQDRLAEPLPGKRDLLTTVLRRSMRGDLAGAELIPVEADAGLPALGDARAAVTWVGHATFVLRLGGLTVLTDPVWSRKIVGTRPRLTPPGVAWERLPRIDAVVISHNHYDHLDEPTVRRLPKDTRFFVPANLGPWFRRRGFTAVTELDWWEGTETCGVRFDFVPARHWSRRTLTDTCRSLWGGWVLTAADGTRVYFAGDTGYGPHFAEIGERHPGADLALMPVGAFAPRELLRPQHVDPYEAVRGCREAGAARMASMHWGTFALTAEPLLAPLDMTRSAWAEAGLPRADLWDLAVGETRLLA